MRVVHVGLETTSTRPGGLNRYLEALVAAERAVGIDATAVAMGDQAGAPDATLAAGPASGSILARARRIDAAIRSLGSVDLADLHFAGTAAYPAIAGSLRGVPNVVHFQGPWADESEVAGSSRANAAVKRAVERAVYRRARSVVVLTNAFAGVLEDRYGVARWKIEVVPPGVDLDRFTPGDRERARARLQLGAGRVVLSVRRLVARMGIDVLLRAWSELDPQGADVLAIVGEGPLRRELEVLAESLGVASTVRFCGGVDDGELVDWYRAADLTVVPSVALEGFGLVVLESMACATRVIGSDVAGLAEALELVGQGPGVPAGDVAALAGAIRDALAVPSDQGAGSRRARAEQHGWSAVAARHAAIYDAALDDDAPLRVVLLDHTAVLSGGELAIARALEGVRGAATVHAILASDGPLRQRLEAAGASVEVLALEERARTLSRGAVRPSRLDVGASLAAGRHVLALARRLRELRPDVVHANSLKACLYGGAAARLAGVPCVWHVRDRIESPYLPASAVRLVRTAARLLPSVVVANSASTLGALGVAGRVVPSPLDASIDPDAHDEAADGEVRFAMLGRLAEWKGQRLAIGAFADAFPDGGARLEVVGAPLFGEQAYAASLVELACELGVADRVAFRGFVEDVGSVLARTDVVVHASTLPEPFGQVVIEGMGAGCAVLVADAGGAGELVDDGVDGITYPMGDRGALAAAMRQLAEQPELRRRLGAAGIDKARSFTPATLAPLLLAAWRDARGTRRRGAGHT